MCSGLFIKMSLLWPPRGQIRGQNCLYNKYNTLNPQLFLNYLSKCPCPKKFSFCPVSGNFRHCKKLQMTALHKSTCSSMTGLEYKATNIFSFLTGHVPDQISKSRGTQFRFGWTSSIFFKFLVWNMPSCHRKTKCLYYGGKQYLTKKTFFTV